MGQFYYWNYSTAFVYTFNFKMFPCAGPSGRAVCSRSPAEIVGSNPAGGKDVCLLWVLCVIL
jgi:hypothetical protein